MANSIDYASIFQTALDEQMLQAMTTSKMEAQASQVKYTGGNEIKILKMTLEGLGDYSRTSSTHFPTGDITTSWETHSFDMDRGKEFFLDRMDNDEQFVDIAGQIMSEFQRVHVSPEVDAYRYEAIWDKAVDDGQVGSYTPATSTIFGQLKDDIADLQDVIGETEPLTIYMRYPVANMLDQADEIYHQLDAKDATGTNTKQRTIDGIPIIRVPSIRFKTDFTFSATDGFSAGTYAMPINWIIAADRAVIGIVKTEKPRIFSPDVNQDGDGWKFQYRKYHTLIIPDNKLEGVYVNYYNSVSAPALTATIAGGSASGTTSFTATAGTGNTLAYVLGASSPGVMYQDLIADGSPTGAVTGYISGADITATAGQVLTMLELDSNSRVVKILEDTLESGDITT